MNEASFRIRLFRIGGVLGIWTLIGVFLASQAYLMLVLQKYAHEDLKQASQEGSWWELLRLTLAEAYIWALVAWFIFRLGRRFPLEQRQWLRNSLIHGALCLLFVLLETTLSVGASEILRHDFLKITTSHKILLFYFAAKFPGNVLIYWGILGVHQAMYFYRKYRERELRASQLETRLIQAQLQVLKMQLHPHFLFNTLNAISALIHQDVELADRMIARLGDLLRTTLENANKQEIPLRQELDLIQPYLEIEKARLGSRLTVAMSIDPAAMDACVPNLILQPLVENAIRHGIAPRSEPGRIEISVRRDNGALRLQVRDDGPGIPGTTQQSFKEGVGLANTRARLEQLYGRDLHLELANGPGSGLTVSICIPYHEAREDTG